MIRPVRHPDSHDAAGQPAPRPPERPDLAELAALYAAGAATEAERDLLESLVKSGDPDALHAMTEAGAAMDALVAIAPEIAPPENAERLLRMRLGLWEAQTTAPAPAHTHHDHDHDEDAHEHARRADPLVVVRKNQIKWRPTGLPGVQGCTLYADKKNNRRTVLLNMAPGSYIPDHNHGGIEEVLVLEGDLNIGDVPLKAGDYFRAQPDTRHGAPVSPSGCIALVFSTYSAITTKTKMQFALQVLKDLLKGGRRSA